MSAKRYWTYRTLHGVWSIRQLHGQWHPMFNDEDLGSYRNAQQAIDDLVSGATSWPSIGNPADCRLPYDLEEWIAH
jgi:hypothetical protein